MAAFGPPRSPRSVTARNLQEITSDPSVLDSSGRWAVVMTFEGELTCARFANWTFEPPSESEMGRWQGPESRSWQSSLNQASFMAGVERIRVLIAAGDVYQVNLCRVLRTQLPDLSAADPARLASLLVSGNPAPYGGFVRLPGTSVVTASPELFLARSGSQLTTGPIKGTGATPTDLSEKDRAENVMIVDLMRNDLGRVCRPGTVRVPGLLELEHHPGLVHLVSRVSGQLHDDASWPEILRALAPAGSVSGAPKLAALAAIADLESVPRGPYCGAVGWVDADRRIAELAVGIRTFWLRGGDIHFGTGAGITWASDPAKEWEETVLKARILLRLASSRSE